MSNIYLPRNACPSRIREAENARQNRLEIVKAYSHGQVSRREIFKWGLVTAGGLIAPIGGLSPFVKSAHADSGGIPTGAPPSPLFGATPFSQPLQRLEVLPPTPATLSQSGPGDDNLVVSSLTPNATRQSLQDPIPVPAVLGGGTGPREGRPPGEDWAHQRWSQFAPKVQYEVTQLPVLPNSVKFHPRMPAQNPTSVWTFNGAVPLKLVLGRYGEPILLRHHNGLPADVTQNGGFGRHTISTHEHNGHHGAESDGFTGAFFYPGQYYDYHWPMVLAGFGTINADAIDPRAGRPDDNGGITKVAGDWHEAMSTHWFHDHMFGFTAQNVYKGNAAMFNIYSSLDRGNEAINDTVNFRLPSGTAKSWGNLDYDVNLMIADKAFDQNGQLYFDIFSLDGFLGDVMMVNAGYKPYFEVEARKYRFRILNASVARFFKIGLCDQDGKAVPMIQIGNDGNLLPQTVTLTELDEQGTAERYDIVIDFTNFVNKKLYFVNLCEHQDGAKPSKDLRLADALAGKSNDPCVGKFLEFRVGAKPANGDPSQVPTTLIPNPDLSKIPVARERTFEFGRSGGGDAQPWTIKTNGGQGLTADFSRVSALPKLGACEIWHLKNGGGGWDHPIHIHFEESQMLARNGSANNVPAWEKGRKDVYRLQPSGEVTIKMQFREFAGMYMEHCHNTQHEDNAMLLRWDVNGGGLVPLPAPNPSPQGVTFIPSSVLPTAL